MGNNLEVDPMSGANDTLPVTGMAPIAPFIAKEAPKRLKRVKKAYVNSP